MNSLEIKRCLKTFPSTKNIFVGVYASDTIPDSFFKNGKPRAVIFNLDNSNKPGTHWVTLYTSGSGSLEYYDSYGLPPFHIHLFKNFKRFKYNKKRIQGKMNACGLYAMHFVIEKSRKKTMKAIVKPFGSDHYINDAYIKASLCDTFAQKGITLCTK